MVVQHNMQAMNANRTLNITTGAQGKSTEKLSSGYKINRAADDAAGLSISEKMRRQIRGLDRASSNAQDGVSSIQTAEGALNEVHDMLQRMNELANQASNGTNSANDRQSIQDEISALNTEIDRVAETTKFNETYLLKGDAGTKEITLKAHDAGIDGSLSDQGKTAKFDVKLETDSDISISSHNYHIYGDGDEVDKLQAKLDDADSVIINGTTYNRVEKTIAGEEAPTAEELQEKINDANTKITNSNACITALRGSLTTKNASVTAKNGSVTAKQACVDKKQECVDKKQACVDAKSTCVAYKKTSLATKKASLAKKKECAAQMQSEADKIDGKIGKKNDAVAEANLKIEAALAMLEDDDPDNDESANEQITAANEKITNANACITALRASLSVKNQSVATKNGSVTSKQACVDKKQECVDKKQACVDGKSTCVGYKKTSVASKKICLAAKKECAAAVQSSADKISTKIDKKSESVAEAQKEIDEAVAALEKLSNGGYIEDTTVKSGTFESDGREYQLNEVKALIVDGAKVGFGDSKARTAVDTSVNKNNITLDDAKSKIKDALLQANQIGADDETAVKVSDAVEDGNGSFSYEITKGSVEVAKEKSFELHVGADADLTNKITVNIETMNSKYLGVQDLNVVDDSGIAATYAIDAIEDALSKVSEQRSALGAVQNRLEHTINNLDNVVENTQSAESQIRDTDIADEMVRYSKNNILSQAGQSMLAQANQSTQGALSLLG